MSFAHLVGSLLQQNLSARLAPAGARPSAGGGGGLDHLLGGLLGQGNAQGQPAQGLGPLFELAQQCLGGALQGRGAAGGGLGGLAGALLGGGRGSAGQGAMALLATLALQALQGAGQRPAAPLGLAALGEAPPPELTDTQAEVLMMRAMIGAAKADGQIDPEEMERILGKAGEDGLTDAEHRTLVAELQRPPDIDALAQEVSSPLMAAQVYAASLCAIRLDTQAEHDYLARLAQALRLDPATLTRLHAMTGAPDPVR